MQNTIRRSYVAVDITLTNANQNYNILDLVNIILAAESPSPGVAVAPGACRELSLQSTAGNTANVLIGDAYLSSTRKGYALTFGATGTVGAQRIYRAENNSVDVGNLYARSGTSGQILSVEIVSF